MKEIISEEKLRKIIRRALQKINILEVAAPSVFESDCMITVDMDENITSILTKVRAIESITTVVIEPGGGRQVGMNIERLRLRIKFVKVQFSVKQRLSTIISKVTRISGVVGFKVQRTKKLERVA